MLLGGRMSKISDFQTHVWIKVNKCGHEHGLSVSPENMCKNKRIKLFQGLRFINFCLSSYFYLFLISLWASCQILAINPRKLLEKISLLFKNMKQAWLPNKGLARGMCNSLNQTQRVCCCFFFSGSLPSVSSRGSFQPVCRSKHPPSPQDFIK